VVSPTVMTQIKSPPSTCATPDSAMRVTAPVRGAVIAASIFIASIVATVSPADTDWPTSAVNVTAPANGAARCDRSPRSAFSAVGASAEIPLSRTDTGRSCPLRMHITVRMPASSGSLIASSPISNSTPFSSLTRCLSP
jgi:hypothetical protein